jgi:hypothetical protein
MLLKFSHGNIFTHTNNCNCVIDFIPKCIEFSSRDRFLLMWFYQSMDNFIFMVIFGSISSINNVFFYHLTHSIVGIYMKYCFIHVVKLEVMLNIHVQ